MINRLSGWWEKKKNMFQCRHCKTFRLMGWRITTSHGNFCTVQCLEGYKKK